MKKNTNDEQTAPRKCTKRTLMQALNERLKIRQDIAVRAVELVFSEISSVIIEGGNCEFRDFGVFLSVKHKSRVARNPHHPTDLYPVEPRASIRFKPGNKLRKALIACSNMTPAERIQAAKEMVMFDVEPVLKPVKPKIVRRPTRGRPPKNEVPPLQTPEEKGE